MNWQQVKSNWTSVRPKVHSKWAKLTDGDLDAIQGNRNELIHRLEERYQMDKKKAEQEADAFAKMVH